MSMDKHIYMIHVHIQGVRRLVGSMEFHIGVPLSGALSIAREPERAIEAVHGGGLPLCTASNLASKLEGAQEWQVHRPVCSSLRMSGSTGLLALQPACTH